MLCCSLIVILLGQCGALAGAAKVRMLGGASVLASSLHPIVAGWSAVRWLILGTALAAEIALGAFAFPVLYAIDVPSPHLAAWPICAAAARLLAGGGR